MDAPFDQYVMSKYLGWWYYHTSCGVFKLRIHIIESHPDFAAVSIVEAAATATLPP